MSVVCAFFLLPFQMVSTWKSHYETIILRLSNSSGSLKWRKRRRNRIARIKKRSSLCTNADNIYASPSYCNNDNSALLRALVILVANDIQRNSQRSAKKANQNTQGERKRAKLMFGSNEIITPIQRRKYNFVSLSFVSSATAMLKMCRQTEIFCVVFCLALSLAHQCCQRLPRAFRQVILLVTWFIRTCEWLLPVSWIDAYFAAFLFSSFVCAVGSSFLLYCDRIDYTFIGWFRNHSMIS